MLHRASLAVPTLSPPKNGSLRQAALASVQRLQADSASPVNTQSTRKRSDSPNAHSPSNFPPLAQRIRSDLQIGEESPEREQLRTQPTPLKFPSPSSPRVKGFPPPAPLVFTPPKIQEGFETPVAQSGENVVVVEKVSKETAKEVEVAKVAEQDSDWETVKDAVKSTVKQAVKTNSQQSMWTVKTGLKSTPPAFADSTAVETFRTRLM